MPERKFGGAAGSRRDIRTNGRPVLGTNDPGIVFHDLLSRRAFFQYPRSAKRRNPSRPHRPPPTRILPPALSFSAPLPPSVPLSLPSFPLSSLSDVAPLLSLSLSLSLLRSLVRLLRSARDPGFERGRFRERRRHGGMGGRRRGGGDGMRVAERKTEEATTRNYCIDPQQTLVLYLKRQ